MKKRKIIALTLLVAFLFSLCIPGTFAIAEDGDDTPAENKGMEINKTATANDDGTYTITLEAYATGEKITSTVNKDVPTDIVLVLDQSGSMEEKMNTYGFRIYTNKSNSDYYNLRHNGARNPNLYYQLKDGSYASVSVERTQTSGFSYTACPANWPNDGWNDGWNDNYYRNRNNLYVKVGEEYQQVTLTRSGSALAGYTYTYTFPDGDSVKSSGYSDSPGDFGGKGPLYVRSATQEYSYTYTYTNNAGEVQTIGTSTGASTQPSDFTLYERYQTGTITRLKALKDAVTTFANSVQKKATGEDGKLGTEDDVDHRIAVVGFATGDYSNNDDYPTYENTELFIGGTQYNYNVDASSYYGSAFQKMNTQAGYDNVIASKNALAARGATYTNYGLMMANGILEANPVPAGERRNRVIIVFTDGQPGYSSYDSKVAQNAIDQAQTAKNNGTTVYAVGIFEGADATSAGNASGDNTEEANWFMQNVSSNNGTPQTPSYYLSAADADTLNSIFQQISDQIESGGSSSTLGESAVIRDIIAPSFQLPAGSTPSDITLETYAYGEGNSWTKNDNAMGAVATVDDGQVNVTGFNFSENWCGTETAANGSTTYRGNKLVISFNVVAKDGFLGGNNVPTNTSAGVYESDKSETPVAEFPVPTVNVPIQAVTVTAEDKNVYLLGGVTRDQLLENAAATVGSVPLDLDVQNFGLEEWQYAYVDLGLAVYDNNINSSNKVDMDVTTEKEFTNMENDGNYGILLTVTPKTEDQGSSGTAATAREGIGAKMINVFKPELTYKDGEAWYGDAVPTDFSSNLDNTDWKHDGKSSSEVTMIGTAPVLSMTYTLDNTKITNGKINTKQDVPVDVAVKIGDTDITQYTTFMHNNCTGKTCSVPLGSKFLLHIKTCQLTITKTGGAANEPYVFTVYKDGVKYSEVTITGNGSATIYELPVGTYTIREDTGWSWRYNPSYSEAVNLSKDNSSGSITCTNTLNKYYWLNGYSAVEKNIFGVSHNKSTN